MHTLLISYQFQLQRSEYVSQKCIKYKLHMHILLAHFVLNFKFLSTLLRVVQHWLLIFIVYLVLTVDQVYHTKRYINYCQL